MSVDSPPRADDTRLAADRLEIATLAGGLAHEIKNPLSVMSLNLELLAEDLDGSEAPRDRRMLRKIQSMQRECKNLETILEDFLRFARAGELEAVDSDLNRAVQEFIEFYAAEAEAQGIEISPHLATDLPLVRIDPRLFRQVLMNLTLNAQQAMPRGGLLELQTGVRDGWLYLDLIDTGMGMDEVTLSKLFQAFFSTKPQGSGLGLPTVKRIVEAHGGRISVQSAPGRGTRVTLAFPSVPQPAPARTPA